MELSSKLQIALPPMYCPDCRTQLGFSGVYLASQTDTLVCGFCARDRIKAGEHLRPVLGPGTQPQPGQGCDFEGEGEPLDGYEAAALLVRHGAQVSGVYIDPETGEQAADVLRDAGIGA